MELKRAAIGAKQDRLFVQSHMAFLEQMHRFPSIRERMSFLYKNVSRLVKDGNT